jgi:aldose 1-epimerase
MKQINTIALCILGSLLFGCVRNTPVTNQVTADPTRLSVVDTFAHENNFLRTLDGKQVGLFTLKNEGGVTVKITNYGASIVQVLVPDKYGRYEDIALGYSTIDGYINDGMYLGCTVGRYANRIARGQFILDGKKYNLAVNNGQNSLHGGLRGFNKVVWDARQEGNRLLLSYVSPDMEEGYPGKLTVHLTYTLTPGNELKLEYEATTDKKTVINLTNHCYFNLHGEGIGSILDHQLEIFSDAITPVDSSLIPTGTFMKVTGTPFDFNTPHMVGERIGEKDKQLQFGKGYDHNFVIRRVVDTLSLAIRLVEPALGRVVELYTTEPGIQFYSGNFMDGKTMGKTATPYAYRTGLAMEPQHFPDSPNQKNFPSVVLKPGETYHQTSVFRFSVLE